MKTLTSLEFKQKVFNFDKNQTWKFEGKLPAIIDFYAEWCGPCKMQAPILKEIAEEYAGQVDIYKVNTEASPELASLFRIRGIPSLLFVPTVGKPSLSSGFSPKPELKRAIFKLFNLKGANHD